MRLNYSQLLWISPFQRDTSNFTVFTTKHKVVNIVGGRGNKATVAKSTNKKMMVIKEILI